MSVQEWLDHLVGLQDPPAQHAFLQSHRAELTIELFEALKSRSDAQALQAPQRALAISELAVLAASYTPDPLAEAQARWARGNAWLCLERCQDALHDYDRAYQIYQAQGQDQYRQEIGRLQANQVSMLKDLGRYAEAQALADTARATLAPWGKSRAMAALEMSAGSLYRLVGCYSQALAAYERGRAIFVTLGDVVQAARMDINRARALVCLDRFAEAEPLLAAAGHTLSETDQRLPAARSDLNRATLLSRQGQHRQALVLYRQVRDALADLGVAADVAVSDLYMSYDYLALNLLPEAMERATAARESLAGQSMPRYAALANGNLAVAARKLGRCAEALQALDQARAFFVEREVAVEAALLDLERALCLCQTGDVESAAAKAAHAAQVLVDHQLPFRSARAGLILAACYLALGQVDRSAELYAQALETLQPAPSLVWEAHDGLGQVAEVRGQLLLAYEHYGKSIACIEAAGAVLGSDDFAAGFLEDKLDVYRRAVRVALTLGDQAGAFSLAQQSKTGVWRDFMAQPGMEGEGAARLETLRRQWHWLYNRLARPDEGEGDTPGEAFVLDPKRGRELEETRWAKLHVLERQMAQVRRDNYPALLRGSSPAATAIQEHIPRGTLLLDYYCTMDAVSLFVLDGDQTRVLVELASLRDVYRLVSHWHFNLDGVRLALFDGQPATRLADEAHAVLQELYQQLLAPVEAYLASVDTLWIVPHAALWGVPFAALHDGSHYLVEKRTLIYLPGLIGQETLWSRPLSHEIGQGGSVSRVPLVVGFSDRDRLSYTLSEARAVAAVLEGSQLLLEEEATINHVRTGAAACTLLHLATHGFFRADSPLFSALHLADGALTAENLEMWSMPQVELVTLSACETGLSKSWGSDLLGLARSFWRAGARRLVASMWAVDDISTADLMVHFYDGVQKGQSVALALCSAQSAALAKYRHPFYWAGFQAIELV